MRLFQNANYKFIELRRKAYVLSGIAILIGIGAMLYNISTLGTWQNYGVDFTGGSLVQVRFDSPDVDAAQVRAALGGSQAPPITKFGEGSEFVIRTPLEAGKSLEDVAAEVGAQLEPAFGAGSFTVVRTESVSAKVGAELVQKAALAILFSFVLTLVYLAIRFEFRFGLAAIVATFHDMVITLGFLALFRVEIALPSVAAILTVIGYSLNDTIIVFDRIRENMHKKGARKRDQVELINESINETLPRTILTSGTTLVVLVSLLVLGGAVIRDFTEVLILGIVIGTYSSVFVAAPALVEIQKRWGEGKTREKKPKPQPATV
ncbi:MAG TPA: protein translocase subunit SecF [Longimicrobiales bacterium]|nr:protein translocase subunit SecF [Longimicrobiales bacterium]